jgi:glycosyltransferase involved in cell wall biosynthesis
MQATVVIPTYERPGPLRKTVQSVCTQTADNYDVVVVDDGSSLDSQAAALEDIAESYDRVTVLTQENQGPAAARNNGWQWSDADIVFFTDDDCLVPENWITDILAGFEDGIAAVGGQLVPTDAAVERSGFARLHQYKNETVYGRPDSPRVGGVDLPTGGTANIAYRRSVLDEVDGFDESFPTAAGEDADLLKRVADAGYQIKYVPVHVEHNAAYDWQSFRSRTVRHGKGKYYYDRRHGTPRPSWRVILGLLASPVFFVPELVETRNPEISGLVVLERLLSRYGELHAMRHDSVS